MDSQRRMARLLALALLFVGGLACRAGAAVHFGALSVPPDNAVNFVFVDNMVACTLVINGGALSTQVIPRRVVVGHQWTFTVNSITLASFGDDEITVDVALRHTSIPHPVPDRGFGIVQNVSVTALAEDATPGVPYTVLVPVPCLDHGDHWDSFGVAALTINIATGFPDIDDITSWSFVWLGSHCWSCFSNCSTVNDFCGGATAVDIGVHPYSTIGATTDGPPGCGGLGADIWFVYTSPVARRVRATTCSPDRSYDTVMSVFSGGCGALVPVDCNDDGPPFCAEPDVPYSGSTVEWDADAGVPYLIQVGGYGGSSGLSELTIGLVAAGCACDFNGDGFLNSQDFFDFLTCFFTLCPLADFNHDGLVNGQDFFDFVNCYFAGC